MTPHRTDALVQVGLVEDALDVSYKRVLEERFAPEQLIDLQLWLEGEDPLFKLSEDSVIEDKCAQLGLTVRSYDEVESLQFALSDLIHKHAETEGKVQKYLAKREYQLQLRGLPQALSNLERAVGNYEALAAPVEAVMRYVWETVTKEGFSMTEEGYKAVKQYEGNLSIKPWSGNRKVVEFRIDLKNEIVKPEDGDHLVFYLFAEYKTKAEPVIGKTFWRGKEIVVGTRHVKTDEVKELRLLPCQNFNLFETENCYEYSHAPLRGNAERLLKGNMDYARHEGSPVSTTPSDYINDIATIAARNPDQYAASLGKYLNVILKLPTIMHNYATRTQQRMSSILSGALDEVDRVEA